MKNCAEKPESFMKFIDNIEEYGSPQLQHMLKHLFFPENFEPIASKAHKRRIIEAFSGFKNESQDQDGSIDNQIKNIKEKLKKLPEMQGQGEIDFYESPLRDLWLGNDQGAPDEMPMDVIQYKKQVVLYGPPGTGKTFRAKELAKQIIRSAALKNFGVAGYLKSQGKIASAIETNVHRLQLHPAYSYEEFIQALHISKEGGTEYRDGYLLRLLKTIKEEKGEKQEKKLPHVLILDEMNRTDLSRMLGECFSLLEDRNESIDLASGREKLSIPDDLFIIGTMNLIDQSVEQIDFALRRRFLWIPCPFDKEALIEVAKFKWEAKSNNRPEPDFDSLGDAAKGLNAAIRDSDLLGSQYEIGHTYFLDVVDFLLREMPDGGSSHKKVSLWKKNGKPGESIEQIWKLSLCPLLEQYLGGLDEKKRKKEMNNFRNIFFES